MLQCIQYLDSQRLADNDQANRDPQHQVSIPDAAAASGYPHAWLLRRGLALLSGACDEPLFDPLQDLANNVCRNPCHDQDNEDPQASFDHIVPAVAREEIYTGSISSFLVSDCGWLWPALSNRWVI